MKTRDQLVKKVQYLQKELKLKNISLHNKDLFGNEIFFKKDGSISTTQKVKEKIEKEIIRIEKKVNFAAYCVAYYDNMVKKGIDMGSRLTRVTDEIATIKRQTDSAVMTVAQRKAVFHQKAFHLVSEMEVLNNILDA